MSPANRASPCASGGRGVSGTMFPVPVYQASTTSPLRSSAVKTACTPGSASAAEVSMEQMRALRVRAADEAGVQHARPGDVVDEGARAGQQPGVLDPRHPAARVAGRAGLGERGGRHPTTSGSFSQPRTDEVFCSLAASQSTSQDGQRLSISSSATRPSSRARAEPRQ